MRKILFEEKAPIDSVWVFGLVLLVIPAIIIAIILFQSHDSIFYFKTTIFAILTIIVSATISFFIEKKIKLRTDELVIQRGPIITAIPLNEITEIHELSINKPLSLKEQFILISNFEKKANIKIIHKNPNQKTMQTTIHCQNPKKLINELKKLAGPTGFEPATP